MKDMLPDTKQVRILLWTSALLLVGATPFVAMADWVDNAKEMAVDLGARVGGALLIFIVGMIVARLVSAGIFHLLQKTDWDDKIAQKLGIHLLLEGKEQQDEDGIERFVSKVVYFLLMLIVIVAVLDHLGLESAAAPLENLVSKVTTALPDIGKAILILVIAWAAGTILMKLISRSLGKFDGKLTELSSKPGEETKTQPFSETTGKVVFWLVMIVGIASAVEALKIDALADPMQGAIDKIVDLFPKVAMAALILLGGFFLSRIMRQLVQSFLSGVGADKLPEKVKFEKVFEKYSLSEVGGLTVMYVVLFHASVAALDRLELTTLSEPLTDMTSKFWNLLPILVASAVLIVVGVIFGRVLRGIVESMLKGIGFDDLMKKLGFEKVMDRSEKMDQPSELVGFVVQATVILLIAAQVLQNLQLDTWAIYVNTFLGFILKNAIVASIVVIVGFAIGNYVRDAIVATADGENDSRRWLASLARYTILVFAVTMAIQQLGVAEDFVLLSFALLFGALCLALALAFGLGSRDIAQEIVKDQYDKAKDQFAEGDKAPKKTGLTLGAKKDK